MTQSSLGILMLKTRFPRPPGDVGNPDTWPFPVLRQVIEAATVDRVVNANPPIDLLLEPFIAGGIALAEAETDILEAGDALAAKAPDLGAVVLECANMAPYSRALGRYLGVPVYDIVTIISWLHAGLAPRTWPKEITQA